jgi:hypothetical protein
MPATLARKFDPIVTSYRIGTVSHHGSRSLVIMWCSNCRQDVPAIATPDDGKVRCTKCRQQIASKSAGRSDPLASASKTPDESPADETKGEIPAWAFVERPPIDIDAWQWDEDLLEAERLVRAYGPTREAPASQTAEHRHSTTPTARVDRAHARDTAPKRTASLRSPKFAFLSWAVLSLGVMALVFGGVLIGWSFWSGQQQFWTLGLPFTLGGQAGLILGLVLQLDGLWQSNQDATVVLTDLDEQIDELRQATSLLTTSHSSHAQSFYFHLAEGASPHMLLSDLKGQLDLLAMRMAKDDSP